MDNIKADCLGRISSCGFSQTFLCERGINHWGNTIEVFNSEVHDCARGMVCFGDCHVKNVIFNGLSGNTLGNEQLDKHWGFQFCKSHII